MHLRQLLLFGITGATGAIMDVCLLYIYTTFIHIPVSIAFFLSAVTVMFFVFFVNKYVTFKSHSRSTAVQATRFFIVYIPATFLNAVLSNIFLYAGIQYLFSKCIAIGIVAIVNYMFSHYFIFNKQ